MAFSVKLSSNEMTQPVGQSKAGYNLVYFYVKHRRSLFLNASDNICFFSVGILSKNPSVNCKLLKSW